MLKSRRRHRSGRISIDMSDYLDEIEDDVLIEEVRRRELSIYEDFECSPMDLIREAHRELLKGRAADAQVILERLLYPKWRDRKQSADKYAERMAKDAEKVQS